MDTFTFENPEFIEMCVTFYKNNLTFLENINKEMLIYAIVGTVIITTVMGLLRKTVVYYDYDDMMLCLGTFISPIAMFSLCVAFDVRDSLQFTIIILLPSLIMLFFILLKTLKSGVVIMLPFVLFTKLFLSLFLVFSLYKIFSPSGHDAATRNANRVSSIFMVVLITPIVLALVRNKRSSLLGRS